MLTRRYRFLLDRSKRTVVLGAKSLWGHRLRSLLTVLGIVFGVCSVISMLAIGEGLSYEAQEQIRQLGSNNIILRSVKPPEDKSSSATTSYTNYYGLTYADVRQIRATIPSIEIIVPGSVTRKDVWNIEKRVDCDVVGTVPWFLEMSNRSILWGRFFSYVEMDEAHNVCVLDDGLREQLFPMGVVAGQKVRIGSDYFRVIGELEARKEGGGASQIGENVEEAPQSASTRPRVYIPLKTAKSRLGELQRRYTTGGREVSKVELHEVTVKLENQEDVVETWHIIEDLLGNNHKKQDYEIVVPLDLLRRAEHTKRMFNIVLGAIAAISLLVGGIGIMNIMLASVTERTREIGIRRALGARRRDIILQFLAETVILSATGGAIGVVLGVAIPFFITFFSEMKTIVTIWSPAIAFSISALVGVVFGLYPAFRAANMDPVEALRHE